MTVETPRPDSPADASVPTHEPVDPTPSRARWSALWAAGLAALVVALWFGQATILFPVMGFVVLVRAIPTRLTLGLRLLLAVPLFLTWMIAGTAIAQVTTVGLNPLLTWSPVIVLVGAIRTAAALRPGRRQQVYELLPWIIAVLAAAFLASAAVVDVGGGKGSGADQRVAIMATMSEDGASHLAIVDTLITAGGLAYTHKGQAASAQWPYPPAFHLIAATLTSAGEHTATVDAEHGGRTDMLWLSMILVFVVLVAATGVLANGIALALGAPAGLAALVSTFASVAIYTWSTFTLFTSFFGPQILGLILLIVVVLVALRSRLIGRGWSLGLGAAALAMTAWSWYFITPFAGSILVLWFVLDRGFLKGAWRAVIGLGVAALAVMSIPMYFSLRGTDSGVLNATGGVTAIPGGMVLGPALAAIAGILVINLDRSVRRQRLLLAGTLALVAAFSYGLGEYQEHTLGTTAYFYGKSLYTVAVIGIAALFGVAAALTTRLQLSTPRAIAVLAIAGLATFAVSDTRPFNRDKSAQWIYRDAKAAGAVRPLFANYFALRPSVEGRVILQWHVTKSSVVDYGNSRWYSALNGQTTQDVFNFYVATVYKQDPKVLSKFIEARDGQIAMITGNRHLKEDLAKLGTDPEALDKVLFNP